MFVRQNQQQFRNSNADVQIFYGSGSVSTKPSGSWIKPVGVSHVYMMLIGAGGQGDGASVAGGSGAVTVWYGSAQHVPDQLVISAAGSGGGTTNYTSVKYQASSGYVELLSAKSGGSAPTAGAATAANQFAASGFYQSVAGQDGGGNVTPSATTFLSGGCITSVSANYGYSISANKTGYFMLQPIIVGCGSDATSGSDGVGCGGGFVAGGGPGMVLIASW